MDDTTSPPKLRTKYKYGKKKRTQHLAKILKQRKVYESSDSDSTIITIPNVPSCTSSIATTSRTQTKWRVMDSALPKVCHPEKDTQWCLVDLGQLNGLLKCPSCEIATRSFSRGEGRYGFCYTISLSCSTCHVEAAHTYSSRRSSVKKSSQPFIVNDLIVLFFNQLGLGHTAMKIPIYKKMTDAHLIKRMEKGKIQNSNECVHSVIWSMCPHKLHGAAASAVAVFSYLKLGNV